MEALTDADAKPSLRTLDLAENGLNDAAKAQLSKLAEARDSPLRLVL